METFVELIKAIVWPATLIWFFYYFKSDLRSLLDRIDSLKYKEAEASFKKDVSEAHAEAKNIRGKSKEKKSAASSQRSEDIETKDQLYRIAQISPRASIVESWRYLEEKINQFGPAYNLQTKGYASERTILENLKNEQKINEAFFKLYLLLRELRNRAAHKGKFNLSQESAEEFIDSILEMVDGLDSLLGESV